MEPKFNKIVLEQLELAAKKAYPGECCGILIGTRTNSEIEFIEAREATNQTQGNPQNTHFVIDPLDLYQVEKELEGSGQEIVGIFHSHPNCKAILSDEDRKYMVPGLVYTILSVTENGVVDIKSYTKTSF